MATGDVTLFEEYTREIGEKVHDFSNDTLKIGLVDDTLTPLKSRATPKWADFVANEVSTGGNYTGDGETIGGTTWTESAGVSTLAGESFTLAQDAGGFADAYWGIIYNDTATNDEAIAFVELGGPVSEVAGDVTIKFNGADVGVAGSICTHSD